MNSLHFGRPTFHFLIVRDRVLLYVTLATVFRRIGTTNVHYKLRFCIPFTVKFVKKALPSVSIVSQINFWNAVMESSDLY